MNNLDDMDLDPTTRDQLHEIQQDADLDVLMEAHNENIERISLLEEKVDELERAREVQIRLNAKFQTGMKLPQKINNPEPQHSWVWRLFNK